MECIPAIGHTNANGYCSVCGEEYHEIIASGSCGERLAYTLTDEGTLTISGTGEMEDYLNSSAPWYNLRSCVKNVVVADGVTSIGVSAFRDCSNLNSIIFSDSIISICMTAFLNCSKLTTITLPEGLKTIDMCAFSGCSALSDIIIPDSVTYISYGVF